MARTLPLLVAGGERLSRTMQRCAHFLSAAFSALRAFALSERNWTLTAIVGVLSLIPFGANVVLHGPSSQHHDAHDRRLIVLRDFCNNTCAGHRPSRHGLHVGIRCRKFLTAQVSSQYTDEERRWTDSTCLQLCVLVAQEVTSGVRLTAQSPVTIITRTSVSLADVLVIAVTWRRTFRLVREASRLGIPTSISSVMLKDGACLLQDVCAKSHDLL